MSDQREQMSEFEAKFADYAGKYYLWTGNPYVVASADNLDATAQSYLSALSAWLYKCERLVSPFLSHMVFKNGSSEPSKSFIEHLEQLGDIRANVVVLLYENSARAERMAEALQELKQGPVDDYLLFDFGRLERRVYRDEEAVRMRSEMFGELGSRACIEKRFYDPDHGGLVVCRYPLHELAVELVKHLGNKAVITNEISTGIPLIDDNLRSRIMSADQLDSRKSIIVADPPISRGCAESVRILRSHWPEDFPRLYLLTEADSEGVADFAIHKNPRPDSSASKSEQVSL